MQRFMCMVLLFVIQIHLSTTQDCDRAACSDHGECVAIEGTTVTCTCDVYFQGSLCDVLNLNTATYDVREHAIVFKWAQPFSLTGYSVVLQIESSNSAPKVEAVEKDGDDTLVVDSLQPDSTQYTLCIDSDANLANDTINFDDADARDKYLDPDKVNCGVLKTAYGGLGPYTLTAITSGCGIIIVLTILVGCHGKSVL